VPEQAVVCELPRPQVLLLLEPTPSTEVDIFVLEMVDLIESQSLDLVVSLNILIRGYPRCMSRASHCSIMETPTMLVVSLGLIKTTGLNETRSLKTEFVFAVEVSGSAWVEKEMPTTFGQTLSLGRRMAA